MYLFDFICDRYGLVNRQMRTVNFQATSRRRVSSVVIFFFTGYCCVMRAREF